LAGGTYAAIEYRDQEWLRAVLDGKQWAETLDIRENEVTGAVIQRTGMSELAPEG